MRSRCRRAILRASRSPAAVKTRPRYFSYFRSPSASSRCTMLVTLAWEIFKRGRDINDACVALGIDEFEDALEVILDSGGTAERRLRAFAGHRLQK